MADFDQFASAEPTGQEEDPAAAFLAREQDQLAGLEDDDFGVSEGQASQEPANEGGDFFGSGGTESQAMTADGTTGDIGFDPLDGVGGPPPTNQVEESNDTSDPFGLGADVAAGEAAEGAAATENGAGDLGFDPLSGDGEAQVYAREDIPQQTLDDYPNDGEDMPAQPEVDPYSSVRSADTRRQEPEKIRIWREEQREMLIKKDADSEEKKGEWREIARKELEDWYKHRDEQLEKTKSSNREAEAAFVHDRDEKSAGHEWERITRLCEFNPKSSRNTKDIARMRSILLQLKQTPLQR